MCVPRPEIFFFPSPAAAQIRLTHFRTTGLSNTKLSTHEKNFSVYRARSFVPPTHSLMHIARRVYLQLEARRRPRSSPIERACNAILSLFAFPLLSFSDFAIRPTGGRAGDRALLLNASINCAESKEPKCHFMATKGRTWICVAQTSMYRF